MCSKQFSNTRFKISNPALCFAYLLFETKLRLILSNLSLMIVGVGFGGGIRELLHLAEDVECFGVENDEISVLGAQYYATDCVIIRLVLLKGRQTRNHVLNRSDHNRHFQSKRSCNESKLVETRSPHEHLLLLKF